MKSYKATKIFTLSCSGLLCAVSCVVLLCGFGLWLPSYETSLEQSRRRIVSVLADAVADDVQRGNWVLAQTRLSRSEGVEGLVSAGLVGTEEEQAPMPVDELATFEQAITMGGGGAPLAKLRVHFARSSEKKARIALILILCGTIAVLASAIAVFRFIGSRLLIGPLARVAERVRSGDEQIRQPGEVMPAEIRDLVDAYTQRMEAIDVLTRERAEMERKAAVANVTQMLAHDVRRPFSLLRIGATMLQNAKDKADVDSILTILIPQLERATKSVEGLVADIMEVGSHSNQTIREPLSPESLISTGIEDVCLIYPTADITFTYELKHTCAASVHVAKVGRVFSNIISNAIQATDSKTNIWFTTRDAENGFIEFCIGNNGSFIPSECLPRLFDAFFTSKKVNGTGLGLAIADKVVKAHGGRIWCESSKTPEFPDGKVEFYFTLPSEGSAISLPKPQLPCKSSEVLLPSW